MNRYRPPQKAINNAKLGLTQREKYDRGGLTPAQAAKQGIKSGVTTAQQISSGWVSAHDICSMAAFVRHRKNSLTRETMPDGGPKNGVIAWNLWGGDEGIIWAKGMKTRVDCGRNSNAAVAPQRRSAKAKK